MLVHCWKTPLKKNTWYPLSTHPEIQFGQYIVPNFVSNSVAIKVSAKEFILISPGEPLLQAWLAKMGAGEADKIKLHIIMPNAYHFLGVAAWQAVFPNTQLYASAAAVPILIEKGVAKESGEINCLEEKQPPFPADYSCIFPPGHRAGDVWLKKQDTPEMSTWITCDSFLNYERMSNQPMARFMQRLLSAAPGFKISQVVKWFIMTDRKGFKAWVLQRLQEDNPTTLIPSHGEISQRDDLTEKLTSLIQNRL